VTQHVHSLHVHPAIPLLARPLLRQPCEHISAGHHDSAAFFRHLPLFASALASSYQAARLSLHILVPPLLPKLRTVIMDPGGYLVPGVSAGRHRSTPERYQSVSYDDGMLRPRRTESFLPRHHSDNTYDRVHDRSRRRARMGSISGPSGPPPVSYEDDFRRRTDSSIYAKSRSSPPNFTIVDDGREGSALIFFYSRVKD
jgi:hypothetical protein